MQGAPKHTHRLEHNVCRWHCSWLGGKSKEHHWSKCFLLKKKRYILAPFQSPCPVTKLGRNLTLELPAKTGYHWSWYIAKSWCFIAFLEEAKQKKKKQNLILVIINIFSDKGVRGEMSVFTQQTPVDFVPQGNGSDWGAVMITWPVLSLPPTTSVFALCCVPSAPCRCTYSFIYSAGADTVYPELVGKAITFLIK